MTIKLMNGKLLLAVSCLLLVAAVGYAQQAPPNDRISLIKQESDRTGLEYTIRSHWEGRGAIDLFVLSEFYPDLRAAWNISDEQYRQIQGSEKSPELQKMQSEWESLMPFMDDPDEETLTKYVDLMHKLIPLESDALGIAMDNTLTVEQKQKIQESLLVSMSEMPILSPSAFEVLNLTEAQKQQMEGIKKELEPEFEKHLKQFADGTMILKNKFAAEREKRGSTVNIMDLENFNKETQAIAQKLMAEDPEFKRIRETIQSQSQAFSEKFRTKMFDVLTDAQWVRLQQLIDNPPEHALVLRKKLREQQGKSEESEKSSVWIPGPGAWQPGSSAIPEQYRQERNSRFPRGENPSP